MSAVKENKNFGPPALTDREYDAVETLRHILSLDTRGGRPATSVGHIALAGIRRLTYGQDWIRRCEHCQGATDSPSPLCSICQTPQPLLRGI